MKTGKARGENVEKATPQRLRRTRRRPDRGVESRFLKFGSICHCMTLSPEGMLVKWGGMRLQAYAFLAG